MIFSYLNYNKSKSHLMSDPMCVKCHQFFGNTQKLNMCSVCYK
ncbi:MAG: hypothetical protein KDD45_16395 [Bdellovibrionales bacterium]|nr:hypothetical protein [Bdellovibrionales bacterium]